jgi:hypothetical protein
MVVFWLPYSSTLEAVCSSEMSVTKQVVENTVCYSLVSSTLKIVAVPSSETFVNLRNYKTANGTLCLLLPCLSHSSTLEGEVICSPETSVEFQQTTRRYNLDDRTLI